MSFKFEFIAILKFRAPEILMGSGSEDMRLTDMWSLGVILFSILTFNYVFFPKGVTEDKKYIEYEKMVKRIYPFPKDCVIGSECRSVICSLLETDQYSRMDCEQILLNNWFSTDLSHTQRRPVPKINRHSINFKPVLQ